MNDARPRVLLATDLSSSAEAAEQYACNLASSWGATLTVISVMEFPPGMDPDYPVNRMYLEELLKENTKKLVDLKSRMTHQHVAVHTHITHGIPSQEVVAAAQAEGTDLIVVGTRGKTGLEHIALGSTAERIIRTAPCPVLAVRDHAREAGAGPAQPPVSWKRMLVPLDFSDCSLEAAEYAVMVAKRTQARIRLLHVLEPVSYGLDFTLSPIAPRDDMRERITTRLKGLVSAITPEQVTADYEVRGGLPADSILESARDEPADLIIMGTHGRRGLSHILWGSVAESVLRKSHCPVLTVRSPHFPPHHRRIISGQAAATAQR